MPAGDPRGIVIRFYHKSIRSCNSRRLFLGDSGFLFPGSMIFAVFS